MTAHGLLTVEGGSAPRRTLDGRDLHCGQDLELQLADGSWLPGRYESSYGESLFYIALALALGGGIEAPIHLPPDAILRWPESVHSKKR